MDACILTGECQIPTIRSAALPVEFMPKHSFKKRWRSIVHGIATAVGLRRLGFFIPYRYAASVPSPPPAYSELESVFKDAEPSIRQVLGEIEAAMPVLKSACEGPLNRHWNGGYFGPLDTAAAFAIAFSRCPGRIVEVGSGSSTHTLHAARAASGAPVEINCIDPAPRSDIAALGVDWNEAVLTEAHVPHFAELARGDIAFFDSSHVLFEGTDVDIIQNRILPVLRPGVVVHIHDIFLPDPYPTGWAHRAYTEQLGFGGWLCGGAYRIVFSSHYAVTRMQAETEATLAMLPPHGPPGGGSLWLERV